MVKGKAIDFIEQFAQFFIMNIMRIRTSKFRARSAGRMVLAWAMAGFRRFSQVEAPPTPLGVRVPFPSYTAAPPKLVLILCLFIRGLAGLGGTLGVRSAVYDG